MKKVLILGAGRGQIGLYKAAKEMGLYTIAGTMPGETLPCLPLADEVCYMNIANPSDVMAKVGCIEFDGVATCCIDTGLLSLGKICDKYGYNGITANVAEVCTDKAKMKTKLVSAGVKTARHFTVTNELELEKALGDLTFPVMVKATDLQGSRGIYVAKNKKEAYEYFKLSKSQSKKDYCVIEEYIDGIQFGAEAFVINGEVLFVLPDATETIMRKTAITVGHYVPYLCDQIIHKKAVSAVKDAIRAVGLDNCAVNVDLILKDNEVYIIELTGRAGANGLPEMVSAHYGVNYYKMILSMAVDGDTLKYWNNKAEKTNACLTRMIVSEEKNGTIEKIDFPKEYMDDVVAIDFFKKTNDKIKIIEDSNDCIGQIIVKGTDIEACRKKVEHIMSKIVLKVK